MTESSESSWWRLLRAPAWSVVVAMHFFVFLYACDVGLHWSVPSTTHDVRGWWALGVLLAMGILVVVDVLVCRRRVKSRPQLSWTVSALVGGVVVAAASLATAVGAMLLASATWGNHAGSDFLERNRLVGMTMPVWAYPLLALFGAFVLLTIWLGVEGDTPRRRVGILPWAGFGLAHASILAAAVGTACIAR